MIEIVNKTPCRTEVILKTIEMDCQNISESEFVRIMNGCLEECNNLYKEFMLTKYEKYLLAKYEKRIAFTILKAREYANNKWKTEKRRLKYIEDKKAEIERNCKKDYQFEMDRESELKFDLDGNCRTIFNGGICTFRINDTNEELAKCYKFLLESKFFTKAIGLRFMYDANSCLTDEEVYIPSYRGEIELIFPNDVEEIVKNEKDELSNSMSHYYGCGSGNYTGD